MNFEALKVPYIQPQSSHTYTPDFVLPSGIVIETKGLFQTADRQKQIMVKAQHPALDLRFVFWNAQAKISKNSKTTYAMWADKNGFLWAHRKIPESWLGEGKKVRSLKALDSLGFKP